MSDRKRSQTVPQLAAKLGIANRKVHHFIKTGQLSAVNLAADPSSRPRYAILDEDFARFLESRRVVPAAQTTPRLRRRAAGNIKEYF